MPKISNRPLKLLPKIRIWQDDYDYLWQIYSNSELGMAGAIREIITNYVKKVRMISDEKIDEMPIEDNLDAL